MLIDNDKRRYKRFMVGSTVEFENNDYYCGCISNSSHGGISIELYKGSCFKAQVGTNILVKIFDIFSDKEFFFSSELSKKGGHVGFVSGTCPWKVNYWLEKRIPEYLAQYIA